MTYTLAFGGWKIKHNDVRPLYDLAKLLQLANRSWEIRDAHGTLISDNTIFRSNKDA